MNRKTIKLLGYLSLSLLIAAGNLYAEIYRWTDKNGKVHYSDKPNYKAKKVKLPYLQTHQPVRVDPSRTWVAPERKKVNVSMKYGVKIKSPANDQAFVDSAGVVKVEVQISPVLKTGAGHVLKYSIDQNPATTTGELEFSLNNVDRGTHTLHVQVFDNQGLALSSKVSTMFHVQRPSALIKQNLKNLGVAPGLGKSKNKIGITAPPAVK